MIVLLGLVWLGASCIAMMFWPQFVEIEPDVIERTGERTWSQFIFYIVFAPISGWYLLFWSFLGDVGD